MEITPNFSTNGIVNFTIDSCLDDLITELGSDNFTRSKSRMNHCSHSNFDESYCQTDFRFSVKSGPNHNPNEFIVQYDEIYSKHLSNKLYILREIDEIFQNGMYNFKCLHLNLNHTFSTVLKTMMKDHFSVLSQGLEFRNEELNRKLFSRDELLRRMRANLKKLQYQVSDKEKVLTNLKKSFNDLSLQTSRAVLERIKCMNDKENLEKINISLQNEIDQHMFENTNLHSKLSKLGLQTKKLQNNIMIHDRTNSSQAKSNYTHQTDRSEYYVSTDNASSKCSKTSDDNSCYRGSSVISSLELDRRGMLCTNYIKLNNLVFINVSNIYSSILFLKRKIYVMICLFLLKIFLWDSMDR